MTDWRAVFDGLGEDYRRRLGPARLLRLGRRADRVQVVPYRGYGTAAEVRVMARVIEDEGIAAATSADSPWRNLLHTLKRLESDEVPGARVRIEAPGASAVATSDGEGYVDARIPLPEPPAPTAAWHPVSLEMLDEPRRRPASAKAIAEVLVPPPGARFGVVSDIDDTIVRTHVTDLLRMARAVLFTNAHTRLPFPGVAAFYRALERGATGADGNPIFYVSQSPWNFFDVLDEYLAIQGIPAGPLLLRDWGRASRSGISSARRTHKADAIRDIMERYPHLPFLLVGDSGQEDPEIYREIVHAFPQRILAIYIRNVTPGPLRAGTVAALADEVLAAGSTLILADDTLAAARDAAAHGWIAADALAEIGEEKTRDETAARREGTLETAPTVEVSPESPPPPR